MKNKICPICKKEFIPTNNRQKYCSIECKDKLRYKKYHKEHKEECKIYDREYKRIHKKQIAKRKKLYRQTHIKQIKEYMENYREHCKEQISQQRKQHRQDTKVSIKKYMKQYFRKYQKVPIHKLVKNLRTRIGLALKGNSKSSTTMKLLGCSIEFFKNYYESKFTKGMTWAKVMNGEIHCDHIRPCARFDLSKVSEQHKCFHFTNLQPLWALDNLKKADNYD